ncbi:dihydrofolate reductase family protein [Pseudarthrobacter sp. P1]|uniref:dihydrofolate reductase family protein n=1 Tax=Pseudarthrobacter sp. P1 TaxID=3418418 RepID=UPI003CEADAD1
MARTQYFVASSIDGFIADADGGLDWLMAFNGFDGQEEAYTTFLARVGAIIMGAQTYRFLLNEHARGVLDGWPYTGTPTWVFTHAQLPVFDGADITFVAGDVAPVHSAALAAAGGANVWMVGGGSLAAQFLDAGLLDELLLSIMPIVLGAGRPLLPITAAVGPLVLKESRVPGGGVVELRYVLARRT